MINYISLSIFLNSNMALQLLNKTNYFFRQSKTLSGLVSRKYLSSSPTVIVETNEKVKDEPIDMENPFEKVKPKCILCKLNIVPNYKNVRLLSQFVSPYTGRIYGRHITGLCEHKHRTVEIEIMKAQSAGLMAHYLKDPLFFKDPKLYDPENPLRPHKY